MSVAATNTIASERGGLVLHCERCGQRNRIAYSRLAQTVRCGKCHAELRSPVEPVEITDEAVFDALIRASALSVLVDFWAPWCGPCKMVAPELAKVAAEGAGRWLVAKVNTEELPSLAHRFGMDAIPTLVLFKDGREIARQSGAMPATAIREFVERLLWLHMPAEPFVPGRRQN